MYDICKNRGGGIIFANNAKLAVDSGAAAMVSLGLKKGIHPDHGIVMILPDSF
jgi:hypothetical protein